MYEWRSRRITPSSVDIADWIQLYQICGKTPLLHPDFLLAALRSYGDDRVQLATCRRDQELLAVTVIRGNGLARLSTFQPSQAPIGFWLQRHDVPTEELLSTLINAQPPWTLSLSLTQQDPDLLARPKQTGQLCIGDYINTARITVSSNWDAYWQARGSNLRQNIRKAKNRLTKAGRGVELRTLTAPEQMRDAVRVYGEIESRSWKASQGTAVSPDNGQGEFYIDLLRRFALRGRARCYQLVIDGQVAASDLCVLGDEEIVILKTTFDDAFRDYSPAFLMREAAFSQLFSEPWCKRIEFYGRVMDWHTRWTDEVRQMYHLTKFRYSGLATIWRASKKKIQTVVNGPSEAYGSD